MFPHTFGIRTYMPVYIASMAACCIVAIWLCRRRSVRWWVGGLLGLAFAFGMTVGAKLLYDILTQSVVPANYLRPSHYLKGGLFGGPLAYLAVVTPFTLLFARNRLRALDLIALTLPLPMIVAKIACFANGCCYGEACDLPWAMTLQPRAEGPADVPRHPTPIYEIVVLLIITLALALLLRTRRDGLLLPAFIAIYGLGRPLTEIFRGDDRELPVWGPFTPSQLVCLLAGACALVVLAWIWCRPHRCHRPSNRAERPNRPLNA